MAEIAVLPGDIRPHQHEAGDRQNRKDQGDPAPRPPRAGVAARAPGPKGRRHREKARKGAQQPVGVLEEDPAGGFAQPDVPRHREHVVAVGVWPVGDRHPRAVAGRQAAEPDQREHGGDGGQGPAVQSNAPPGLGGAVSQVVARG